MSAWTAVLDRVADPLGRGMSRADRQQWAAAESLADVGGLVARWLEGKVASQPGYQARCGPDPETADLIPTLAALNRSGLVTSCSQPGLAGPGYDGAWWEQRAAVVGFCDARTLDALILAAGETELAVRECEVRHRRLVVPVTTREGYAITDFGGLVSARDIRDGWTGYDICGRGAVDALVAAHQVVVYDPEWGRDDVLWPVLDSLTS